MPNLENKQKIIIGIILFVMVGVIIYYSYTSFQKTNEEILTLEETEEDIVEEEEKNANTKELEEIIIHVSGAVQKEGIIKLEEGTRIADAIEMAGGLKENASIKNVNLAYILEDGQKIYIPTIEEEKQEENEITIVSSGELGENVENSNNNSAKSVNINTATQTELETIPRNRRSNSTKNYRLSKRKRKIQNHRRNKKCIRNRRSKI